MRVKKFTAVTPLSESAKKSVATPGGRVFKGVTLIKSGLGNRRDKNFYPPEALRDGVRAGLFEGLRAFADHPDSVSEEIQPERSIRDMVGVYENAKYDEEAQSVRADLRILKAHSWLSEAIDELIDVGHGDKIGLSINGRGETEPTRRRLEEAGNEEVEVNELKRFIELRSTDVVTEAGAGGGFAQLVESARRAVRESDMSKLKKSAVLGQLREAVQKGELAKAKELEAKLDTAEDDLGEAEDGKKTREMGFFKGKKGRKTYEAEHDERETEEADDEADEDDDIDHDAALDEAAEAARAEDGDGSDEDDEADDEVEESEDGEADTRGAAAKFRRSQETSKTREASMRGTTIRNGLGPKTGTVTSGDGRFTKPAKSKGKGGRMSTKTTQGFRTKGSPGRHRESAADPRLGSVLRENARLREQVARQESINMATKLLKESTLPPAVRPHVLRDLIGMSRSEMQAEIQKQASILEAAVEGATARFDDFEVVEGAGATTIREGFYGSRDEGDDLGSILQESGLPMKRG